MMKKKRLGILLSALAAGMIEAFSIMRLHGVFSCIQIGNILLGAVALANGRWAAAGNHLLSVAGFLVGSVLCGLLSAKPHGRRWLLGKGILTAAVLIFVVLLPENMDSVAVCLLALLCGSWFPDISPREDGCVPVIVFGVGVLLGAILVSCLGELVFAICAALSLAPAVL